MAMRRRPAAAVNVDRRRPARSLAGALIQSETGAASGPSLKVDEPADLERELNGLAEKLGANSEAARAKEKPPLGEAQGPRTTLGATEGAREEDRLAELKSRYAA